jgi:tRNA (mo5U34)-methyltransferase
MINYQPLYDFLSGTKAKKWAYLLPPQLEKAFELSSHGYLPEWLEIVEQIPILTTQHRLLNSSVVTIGKTGDINSETQKKLYSELIKLKPWRKGPFSLFGIDIDTEWRSDWKWDRLKNHITPLHKRTVLDVGCGNGYHCWRMSGAGAKMVVGIDPGLRNVIQFHAIRRLYGESQVYVLPLALEDLPSQLNLFDSVFSMGVLYHRRSPFDHLMQLKDCLRSGGELILETLVIEGSKNQVLVPEGRYAQMRNVWFIPSCDTLKSWLTRCGFTNIRLIDVNKTTTEEQRSTEWMQSQSLQDFLQVDNPDLTVEGLPAPVRGVFLANKT